MVNYCVCGGCTNSSLSGHRVHRFPNKKKDGTIFRAWVRFVQMKRRDFTSASASRNAVVCSVHFRPEDYHPGDTMEFNMGCQSKTQVRLSAGAVPSVHTAPSSGPPSACGSAVGRSRDGHGSVRDAASRKRELCVDKHTEKLLVKQLRSTQHTVIKMPFIKEESEDLRVEETFTMKQDTEEQTKMPFIKEEIEDIKENEDIRIEETFTMKHEDTEEETKMVFIKEEFGDIIKEEIGDIRIVETFSVKQEETEEQTDLMQLEEESQDLNEMEEKDQYKTHHEFITKEKSFNSSQTEKTTTQKSYQKTGTIGDFTCHLCGLRFKKHGNLEVHMRVHTGRKLYPCPECGVIFNQLGNLKVHMRTHTGEKPFTCQQCGKSFRQKISLDRHMRVHTGERPFTCQQCGWSFTTKGSLTIHVRTHTGEEPYTCPHCGKSFKQFGNLDVHMRIHSGEK